MLIYKWIEIHLRFHRSSIALKMHEDLLKKRLKTLLSISNREEVGRRLSSDRVVSNEAAIIVRKDMDVFLLVVNALDQLHVSPRYSIWRFVLISSLMLIRFTTILEVKYLMTLPLEIFGSTIVSQKNFIQINGCRLL